MLQFIEETQKEAYNEGYNEAIKECLKNISKSQRVYDVIVRLLRPLKNEGQEIVVSLPEKILKTSSFLNSFKK